MMKDPGEQVSSICSSYLDGTKADVFLLGWKKSFEKINTQTTSEFMVISQLLGGQF